MSIIVTPGGQVIFSGPGGGPLATPNPIPLQEIIPAYPYQEYADDADIQAFFDAYNYFAQGYLDWFNITPLSVYTNPSISGPLLDWVLNGIYGLQRPVISTIITPSFYVAGMNASEFAMNASLVPTNGSLYTAGMSTATPATDDYYKRVATWFTYVGDGIYNNAGEFLGARYFCFWLLRLQVARFLYCPNGSSFFDPLGHDLASLAQNVNVVSTGINTITVTIPAGTSSTFFQQFAEQGFLGFPFQLSITVDVL